MKLTPHIKVFSGAVLFKSKYMSLKSFCCLLLILCCLQCKKTPRQVEPTFYHWQTHLSLSATEISYSKQLQVKRLYAKFFDVDWDANRQQAIPLALIDIQPSGLEQFQIIPTIFITNRTLLNSTANNIPSLAKKIISKIQELYTPLQDRPLTEIQLDCDWTPKTKDKYFDLIEQIKKETEQKNIVLSATIRLHQVKFFEKTGVPPVQKGMLMFYNMGDVSDVDMQNSILDMNIAEQYFINFDRYPLHLDVALPIFAWGVLMRDQQMIKLINNLRATDLTDSTRFIKIAENVFQVIKNTYLDGYYLYQGDKIRLEQVALKELETAAERLDAHISNRNLSLAFYHLDTTVIQHYPYEDLEKICQMFSN